MLSPYFYERKLNFMKLLSQQVGIKFETDNLSQEVWRNWVLPSPLPNCIVCTIRDNIKDNIKRLLLLVPILSK